MHVRLLSQAAWLLIALSLVTACQSAPPPAATVPTQPAVVPAGAVPTMAVPAPTQPGTVPAGATATTRAANTPPPGATSAVAPPTAAVVATVPVAATATPTVRPTEAAAKATATPAARPTNTPPARPTATPSPTREPSTRTLYSAQQITHGGVLPSVLGDKGDDYLYTAERFPQGCRIMSVMAIEYTGDKPSAPAPSATHAGHGWSVVRQTDDPRDIGVHVHWWFNAGFTQMKLRIVYVVRQDWNVDCAIKGRTQDGF